jgi:hypothetical protein
MESFNEERSSNRWQIAGEFEGNKITRNRGDSKKWVNAAVGQEIH